MWQKVCVLLAVPVLLGSGLLHGLWTDRWQQTPDMDEAVARLQRVPLTIGPWQGQTVEVDAREFSQAGYAGCVWRHYENAALKANVAVLLVCGRPGPVSVHTPDACYGGAGYVLVGEPVQVAIPSPSLPQPAAFWKAKFVQQGTPVPRQLRIYWSWYAAGSWEAPGHPRLAFARVPVLYKLDIVCELTPTSEHQEKDAAADFLQRLLPELRKVLPEPPRSEQAGVPQLDFKG